MSTAILVIDADDYGYSPAYDRGIAEAAAAGAIDGASVMVARDPDLRPLLQTGIAIGLHLEPGMAVDDQASGFERLVGRSPDYLDGHHHCHAEPALADGVARLAQRLAVPVRSVSEHHRRRLRDRGIRTADRLLGRLTEADPALPGELAAWIGTGLVPEGITEWMVHPGHRDPSTGSSYDAGRLEDLELLLRLGDRPAWAARGIRRASLDSCPA